MIKTGILGFIGEKGLPLPAQLNAAIVANERAKYVLGVLQLAAANADNPTTDAPTLRSEREACGLVDSGLDHVIADSEGLGTGTYHIPMAAHLIRVLAEALDAMLAPLLLARGEAETRQWTERKKRLVEAIPSIEADVLDGDTIAALTSSRPKAGDGIHLLVMDLRKEINRLQALIAEEDIDGAKAYGLKAEDRSLVVAFMNGVRRTASLKFSMISA
jgi:hypothetical protein